MNCLAAPAPPQQQHDQRASELRPRRAGQHQRIPLDDLLQVGIGGKLHRVHQQPHAVRVHHRRGQSHFGKQQPAVHPAVLPPGRQTVFPHGGNCRSQHVGPQQHQPTNKRAVQVGPCHHQRRHGRKHPTGRLGILGNQLVRFASPVAFVAGKQPQQHGESEQAEVFRPDGQQPAPAHADSQHQPGQSGPQVPGEQVYRAQKKRKRQQQHGSVKQRKPFFATQAVRSGQQHLASPSRIDHRHTGILGQERIFGRQAAVLQNPLAVGHVAPQVGRTQRHVTGQHEQRTQQGHGQEPLAAKRPAGVQLRAEHRRRVVLLGVRSWRSGILGGWQFADHPKCAIVSRKTYFLCSVQERAPSILAF